MKDGSAVKRSASHIENQSLTFSRTKDSTQLSKTLSQDI